MVGGGDDGGGGGEGVGGERWRRRGWCERRRCEDEEGTRQIRDGRLSGHKEEAKRSGERKTVASKRKEEVVDVPGGEKRKK